jgi:hypothetical protein
VLSDCRGPADAGFAGTAPYDRLCSSRLRTERPPRPTPNVDRRGTLRRLAARGLAPHIVARRSTACSTRRRPAPGSSDMIGRRGWRRWGPHTRPASEHVWGCEASRELSTNRERDCRRQATRPPRPLQDEPHPGQGNSYDTIEEEPFSLLRQIHGWSGGRSTRRSPRKRFGCQSRPTSPGNCSGVCGH